jgi:hypothetical protein
MSASNEEFKENDHDGGGNIDQSTLKKLWKS